VIGVARHDENRLQEITGITRETRFTVVRFKTTEGVVWYVKRRAVIYHGYVILICNIKVAPIWGKHFFK